MFRLGLIKGHGFGTVYLVESSPLRGDLRIEKEITINSPEKFNRVSVVK